MNKKYNVAIIGVGMLGKRHLSSLLESELSMDIYCLDINKDALDGFTWTDPFQNKRLTMVSYVTDFPQQIDLAIFAMSSYKRREMFDELVGHVEVHNIIFEKVLFQKIEDYAHVGNVLREKNIQAWVNCARRQMSSYQKLCAEMDEASYIEIHVSGGEWGMACNAIHFLDMIQYLAHSKDTIISDLKLRSEIVDSKRMGYKEVYGRISGTCGKCQLFTITCIKDSSLPIRIDILTQDTRYVIDESKKRICISSKENNWGLESVDFDILYQSQMTKTVAEDILLQAHSNLTSFDESADLHVKLLKPLIEFFEQNGMEKGICPIT